MVTNQLVREGARIFTAFLLKSVSVFKFTLPAAIFVVAMLAASVEASQIRALKIYHMHTHEKETIVFKRNGRYDPAGLKKLNYILRDWRRNEEVRMDPRLFDLIWEVYQKSGSNDYIHVVCGYRAPETNAMLRSRSKGVAEKSQHILGKAMDFFIPDVSLRKLREIGMKFQVGGVGFYPTSGSPFVHMDVGGVRAWPRMPRAELARLFPDGKTLHKPAEGGVMPGYYAALADYKRRVGADSIMVAGLGSKNSDSDTGHHKSLLAALFSSGDENEDTTDASDNSDTVVADAKVDTRQKKMVADQPIVTAAADTEINAPVPMIRPAYADGDQPSLESAMLSQKQNSADAAMNAALSPQPADDTKQEFADLASYKVPVPQLLGENRRPGDAQADMLAASAEPMNSTDAAALGAVPVPDSRPEDQQVAKADDPNSIPSDVKPDEVAALAAQTSDDAGDDETDQDEIAAADADNLDSPDAKDSAQSNLQEMASLDVPKQMATRSFVLPMGVKPSLDAAEAQDAAGVPTDVVKGGRVATIDPSRFGDAPKTAHAARKLTKNLIAEWALAKGRFEEINSPVKAPRFVSATMRQLPTEVLADGFTLNAVNIDPERFSGTPSSAVQVKKFVATN
jgi:uncharacterized protein YcbK (DUF882 family)